MHRFKGWLRHPDLPVYAMVAGAAFVAAIDIAFLIQHVEAREWPLFGSRAAGLLILSMAGALFIIGGRKLRMAIRMLLDAKVDRDAAEAARTPTLMPIIQLDEDGRFAGLSFPTIEIPTGKAVYYAIPRIPGLPPADFMISSANGYERTVTIDFDKGTMVGQDEPEGRIG